MHKKNDDYDVIGHSHSHTKQINVDAELDTSM